MTDQERSIAESIEAWFRSHEDGEFGLTSQEILLFRDGPVSSAATIIYSTKPQCLSRVFLPEQLKPRIAFAGLPGLPQSDQLNEFWGNTQAQCYFVGDADPADLMIFAWLRTFRSMNYLGVSDELLKRHGNLGNSRIRMPLSAFEIAAVSRLPQLCPDYRSLLGKECASLLDDGLKIELEGAICKLD